MDSVIIVLYQPGKAFFMRLCCVRRTAPACAGFLGLCQDEPVQAHAQAHALVHAVLLTVQHGWDRRPALLRELRLLMLAEQHLLKQP